MDWQSLKTHALGQKQTAVKVLVGIGVVFAAYFFGTCSNPNSDYETQMAAWKQERTAILAANAAVNKQVDSLAVENSKLESSAEKKTTQINTLSAATSKLRKQNDSLLTVAMSDTSACLTNCAQFKAAALGFKKEADSLKIEVATLKSRDVDRLDEISNLKVGIDTEKKENAKLVKQLSTVPEYKEDKLFGLFPKPNRVVSFVIGVAVGSAAVAYVTH